jgi:copper(I)-binding protein
MKKILLFLSIGLLLTACGPGELQVRDAWARPVLAGGTGAVYLSLHNGTGQADTLIGASTEVARVAELHTSMMMHEGDDMDMAMMQPVDSIDLAAGSGTDLAPGGYHIMLIDMQRQLVAGDRFVLTLHFENHADIEVEVSVVEN